MARPAQDRTEEILDAARDQLRLDGAERTTVDAVAARAGVGKGTVFLYWPSKARLVDAVMGLETAKLLTGLADELRSGATHLSIGNVVRREISAIMENPDLAPHVLGRPGPTSDPEEFPGRALHRIISVMRAHRLVQNTPTDEIVAGFKTVMSGSLALGLTDPDRTGIILDAAEHLIASTYDRPDATPADVAGALPEVLDALEDTVDELVTAAAPDRPTTAVLRPRERPVVTGA